MRDIARPTGRQRHREIDGKAVIVTSKKIYRSHNDVTGGRRDRSRRPASRTHALAPAQCPRRFELTVE